MTINGHFWIENEAGKVIYDPVFQIYRDICDHHRLDINKPRYRKSSPDLQRDCLKKHIFPSMMSLIKLKKHLQLPDDAFFRSVNIYDAEPYQCALNCIVYKLKGGEGKIIYGDMGWEKKDGSSIWYEFENDLSDFDYELRQMMDKMTPKEIKQELKKLKKLYARPPPKTRVFVN